MEKESFWDKEISSFFKKKQESAKREPEKQKDANQLAQINASAWLSGLIIGILLVAGIWGVCFFGF